MIGLDIRFNVFSVILSVQIRGFDQKTLTKNMGGGKARKHGRIDQPNIGSYLPKMKI